MLQEVRNQLKHNVLFQKRSIPLPRKGKGRIGERVVCVHQVMNAYVA